MKYLRGLFLVFLIVLVGAVLVSCSNSSSGGMPTLDQPPQPPSAHSMAMDLSIFSSEQPDSNATGNHGNYEAAAASLSKIQVVMNRNINRSLDLFENADTANAEEISEGQWQWIYSAGQEGSLRYDIRLVAAQQDDNQLGWELYLSTPVLQNGEQLFIKGITNNEVTEGVWTYFSFGRTGQPGQEIAELNWEIGNNQTMDIELTLIGGNNFGGSEMDYHAEGVTRIIELNPSDHDRETIIEFNTDTHAGFIISPEYNNGDRACWNSAFENINCSET